MKHTWPIYLLIFILAASASFFGWSYFSAKRATTASFLQIKDGAKIKVKFAKTKLEIEIANTDASRDQGLSDREKIGSDGLLFVFDKADQYRFWMKQMKFGLDFVWISDLKIVEISRNVPPPESDLQLQFLDIYQPAVPVDMVLEIPAGQAEKWDLQVGQEMELLSQ